MSAALFKVGYYTNWWDLFKSDHEMEVIAHKLKSHLNLVGHRGATPNYSVSFKQNDANIICLS